MNILFIGVVACQKIIDEKESFKKTMASFDAQYNFSNEQKNRLNKLVKGVMKKFVSMNYEIKKNFGNRKTKDKKNYLFMCTLFSLRYQYKHKDTSTLKGDFEEVVTDWKLNVNPSEAFDKLSELGKKEYVIPEEEKSNSIKYNSLLFSVPEWMIRLWLKQYGKDVTLKLLISNLKPANFYVKRNELKLSEKRFEENELFKAVEGFDNAYLFDRTKGFSKTDFYKLGNCFKEDISYQEALNNIPVAPGMNAMIINGRREIACDLAMRLDSVNGDLTVSIEDEIAYRKAKYQFEKLGLKNQSVLLSDIDLLRAYYAYDTFDLVIAMPESSKLGLIKKNVEILANTSKQDYKKIKYYQLTYLEEASKYANSEGTFAYLVETINQREGSDIVDLFLEKHLEFEVVTSRQIMPFEKNNYGLYYAVLRRIYER